MNTICGFKQATCCLFLFIGFCFSPALVQADSVLENMFPIPQGTKSKKYTNHYQSQFKEIQQELGNLKLKVPASFSFDDDNIACLLDSPYMARFRSGRDQYRFFAGRLVFFNQSEKTIVIKTKDLRLQFSGKEYSIVSDSKLNSTAKYKKNARSYSLKDLKVPEKIELTAGEVGSCWVVFNKLPTGNDIPNMTLTGKVSNKPFTLDVSAQHRLLLRWRRELIGPQGVIAICTIGGRINSINMGVMIDDLIVLATNNVTRVIITFDTKAAAVDSRFMAWLQKVVTSAGQEVRHNMYSEFPSVPSMIREIHLAKLPKGTSISSLPRRIHKSLNAAIIAASQSAYEAIPVVELVKEIREGNPLTRPAALIHGAPRIPIKLLSEVITMAEDNKNPHLRDAALTALSEFNTREAIEALAQIATSGTASVSQAALVSLGASRFPAHQDELEKLLESSPALQQRVVKVLSEFPQKRWAETLYQHTQSGPVALRVESLKSLGVVGHPKLQETLVFFLNGNEATLQKTAYEILSKQSDGKSRDAVIDFTLRKLEKHELDAQVFQILNQHKVQRAVPGLLAVLSTDEKNRSEIIKTLSAIGNDQILDTFVDLYPKLKQSSEKVAVLQAVQRIDQARFLEIAPLALKEKETQIISTVSTALRSIATEESVNVLMEAIKQSDDKNPNLTYLTSALSGLSTPKSRQFLISMRDSDSERKSQAARSALTSLYNRSPVINIYNLAVRTAKAGKHDLAIKQFTIAIEGDPGFPKAYDGRALSYRVLEKNNEALKDYTALVKLDDHWRYAQGRKGQTLTSLGRFEEAVECLTLAIEQLPNSADWYSSRGHAYSMQENYELAEKDYHKALKLNPKDMTALTGVALSMAINGKVDEAIAQVKKSQTNFKSNNIFSYNVACIYSRAAEYTQKKSSEDNPKLKQRVDQLVTKALDELEKAISLGYQDKKWTLADPDLAMLREHERFQKLLLKMGGEPPSKSPPKKK